MRAKHPYTQTGAGKNSYGKKSPPNRPYFRYGPSGRIAARRARA
jgi:hypothetical protein